MPQEGLACGLPVVAYDLPVYRENIAPCAAVLREKAGDISGMARTVCRLLSDDSYTQYSGIGPGFVRRFDWDAVAKREFEIMLEAARPGAVSAKKRSAGMDERTVKKLIDLPPARVKDSCKRVLVSMSAKLNGNRTFEFEGHEYHYLYHPYNLTWRNERSVEVPIALQLLGSCTGLPVLEVGNVLSHYIDIDHEVLDKYESAPGVINADAVDFNPGKAYSLILSISTLEHIGHDEEPREPSKPLAAIKNLSGLLAPGGRLVATIPVGLNPDLDRVLLSGETPFKQTLAMRRLPARNVWEQVDPPSVAGAGYSRLGFRANAILIATIVEGKS
ncbi:MAG TPA: hypothetical protein VIK22_02930 [Candidatus Anoxymicrobiaceae bacterium]